MRNGSCATRLRLIDADLDAAPIYAAEQERLDSRTNPLQLHGDSDSPVDGHRSAIDSTPQIKQPIIMASLQNRVAIVTGAGGGLGREHALLLARLGAKVVVNDILDTSGARRTW